MGCSVLKAFQLDFLSTFLQRFWPQDISLSHSVHKIFLWDFLLTSFLFTRHFCWGLCPYIFLWSFFYSEGISDGVCVHKILPWSFPQDIAMACFVHKIFMLGLVSTRYCLGGFCSQDIPNWGLDSLPSAEMLTISMCCLHSECVHSE